MRGQRRQQRQQQQQPNAAEQQQQPNAAEQLRQAKEMLAKLSHDAAEQQSATAATLERVHERSQELARAEKSKQVQRKATDVIIGDMKSAMERGAALEFAGAALKKRASGRAGRISAAIAADVEKQVEFEAKFEETKRMAATLFRGNNYEAAARLYTVLISAAREALNAKEQAGREFAATALPGLLSNRSACYMDDPDLLYECLRDCTDCLDAMAHTSREDGGASPLCDGATTPTTTVCVSPQAIVSPFKVRLRRAEAFRRMGRIEECYRQSEALSALARTEEEQAAAGYLALQMAVINVE